jgi:flagella basal body P-ring formation protein FlgA
MNMRRIGWLVIAATLVLAVGLADAAEIRLRRQVVAASAVVTLGDVAQIFSNDAGETAELCGLELFSAPLPGVQRFVRLREIQDALELSGLSLARHTFSGSSQVAIEGPAVQTPAPSPRPRPAAPIDAARLRRAVRDAIIKHLREQTGAEEGWTVELTLTREQLQSLAAAGAWNVSGGQGPWTGEQAFQLTFESPDGNGEMRLTAQVGLPPKVVVAVRALPRGAVIHASDVELRTAPVTKDADAFTTVDDVVGMEATAAIHAGQVLDSSALHAPLLVRRGEVVTVYARSAGIRVRTTARARDNGSAGELITVESLTDRKPYYARVSGVQEVEVFARPAQARAESGLDAD